MEGISRVRDSLTWTHTNAHWGGRVRSIYELERAELEGVMDDEWIVGEEGFCQKARKNSYWAPLKTSILPSLMSSLENRIGANNVDF